MKEWVVVTSTWVLSLIYTIMAVYLLFMPKSQPEGYDAGFYLENITMLLLSLSTLSGIYQKNRLSYYGTVGFLALAAFIQLKSYPVWIIIACHHELLACPRQPHVINVMVAYTSVAIMFYLLVLLVGYLRLNRIKTWYKLDKWRS